MFLMKKPSGFVAAIFGVRLQFLCHCLAVLVSRLDKRSDLLSFINTSCTSSRRILLTFHLTFRWFLCLSFAMVLFSLDYSNWTQYFRSQITSWQVLGARCSMENLPADVSRVLRSRAREHRFSEQFSENIQKLFTFVRAENPLFSG